MESDSTKTGGYARNPPPLPKQIRLVSSCPSAVAEALRAVFEKDGWQTDAYSQLWIRLCSDPEMESVWRALQSHGPSDPDYFVVILSFAGRMLKLAEHDYAFEKKTDAERLKWLTAVRAAATRLQLLLREGPGFVAENIVENISVDGVRWFLGILGVKVIPGETSTYGYDEASNRWFVSEWALQRAQRGTEPLSLDAVLDKLIADTSDGVPSTQTISKPRDAKAFRAEYILQITEDIESAGFRLTDEQVATVARVALQDEAITPALANRFRYRAGKDVRIGAVIQDSSDSSEDVG